MNSETVAAPPPAPAVLPTHQTFDIGQVKDVAWPLFKANWPVFSAGSLLLMLVMGAQVRLERHGFPLGAIVGGVVFVPISLFLRVGFFRMVADALDGRKPTFASFLAEGRRNVARLVVVAIVLFVASLPHTLYTAWNSGTQPVVLRAVATVASLA